MQVENIVNLFALEIPWDKNASVKMAIGENHGWISSHYTSHLCTLKSVVVSEIRQSGN
jgi:hypothetical protein